MTGTSQVRFTCIRAQAERRFDSRLPQRQARRRTVDTTAVKLIVNPHELAIRLEKCWIVCNSLIQQVRRLDQVAFSFKSVTPGEYKTLRAAIKIECGEIGSWRTFNSRFFSS